MKTHLLATLLLVSISGRAFGAFNAMTLFSTGLESANKNDETIKRMLAVSWELLPEGNSYSHKDTLAQIFKDKFGESIEDVDLSMMSRAEQCVDQVETIQRERDECRLSCQASLNQKDEIITEITTEKNATANELSQAISVNKLKSNVQEYFNNAQQAYGKFDNMAYDPDAKRETVLEALESFKTLWEQYESGVTKLNEQLKKLEEPTESLDEGLKEKFSFAMKVEEKIREGA